MNPLDFIRDLTVVTLIAAFAGWACRRIGLSVVVGYLLAGIIIGPHTPPFQLVTDRALIDLLAQLGLVFLVFSIGLGLSLARLQRLGVSAALATAVGALTILNLARVLGLALGFTTTQSLFLAGMTMVSSSAIIAKVLEEQGRLHERSGQLALGVTVLEDVVAIVMLTILTPLSEFGGTETPDVGGTLLRLAAFVGVIVVLSVLVVPRLLDAVQRTGGSELRTVMLAGGVLGLGWFASFLGYSTALGAFILGVVVAGARLRVEVERAFDGLRHLFGAIFFVAVGMLFDLRVLAESWLLVLLVFAFVVVARPLATGLALILVGNRLRDAVRAGLTLTPIGEFSFIIAQLGVASLVVPASFQAIAVGLALGTSLFAPLLTAHAERIANVVVALTPGPLARLLEAYRALVVELFGARPGSRVWSSLQPRLLMSGGQGLGIVAILLLGRSFEEGWFATLGSDVYFANDTALLYSVVLGLLLLFPVLGLWRNLAVVVNQVLLVRGGGEPMARHPLTRLLEIGAGGLVALLVSSLLPLGPTRDAVAPLSVIVLLVIAGLFGRRLLGWHTQFESQVEGQFQMVSNPALTAGLDLPILKRSEGWELRVEEVILPAQSNHGGKTIAALALRRNVGCSIAGLDRQGIVLLNPAASEVIYPGDRLLLIGTPSQVHRAEQLLSTTASTAEGSAAFNDLACESVTVAPDFAQSGQTLIQLDLIQRFGVQVCGIRRDGVSRGVPNGSDPILAGDVLLLLGTQEQIRGAAEFFGSV